MFTFVVIDPATLPIRTASHGGAFLFMAVPFNKSARSIPDQLILLQQRGLVIRDKAIAFHYLTHIGYYRLAGYWKIFQANAATHNFRQGACFEEVIDQYDFDRELRLLLYDGIERVEISFRTQIIDLLCMSYGPFWYTDSTYAQNQRLFQDNLVKVEEELDRSKEEFIKHHGMKYGKMDYPPAWKTMQVLSFGTLSKIYSNISTGLPEKNLIARNLGLPNYAYLDSWMLSLSVLRNLCAHHSRVCNRNYDFPPKKMVTSSHPWIVKLPVNNHMSGLLYNQLCSLKFLLDRVSPGNQFKLKGLTEKYSGIALLPMGFPHDWKSEALWN